MTEVVATPRNPDAAEQHLNAVRQNFEVRAGEAEQKELAAEAKSNKKGEALRISYRALEEMHTMAQRVADNPETFNPNDFRKVAAYLAEALAQIRAAGVL